MSKQRHYLVTGAAGFIGARFVESCNERGIAVTTAADRESHFRTRPEHGKVDFGRIVDRSKLIDWLRAEGPNFDAIIHMGASSSTVVLDEDFLERVNVRYSQDLWNYAVQAGIPMVYASSAATYGGGELGFSDDEETTRKLEPLNPYGSSKHRFDIWAIDQSHAGHAPPAWSGFKFFNVYGFGERHKGGQASMALHWFDQIQATGKAKLFKSYKEGFADGQQSRDFVSVEDVVSVLHFAAEKPIRSGVFNLGSGKARSFHDLARAVFSALGKPEQIEFIEMPESLRERYQYFTEAKMDKLRAEGYAAPFSTLEQGVSRYVQRLLSANAR